MKVLVIGCGSIGRRHAGNAAMMGEAAVMDSDAYAASRCADALRIPCFEDLNAALDWGPDGVVVAAPNHLHIPLALKAVSAGCHVLIEKPISGSLEHVDFFLHRAESLGRRVHVVCNMRFHPQILIVREQIRHIGRPLFARAHYGNYLPNMRPGVDYRNLYCSRKESGGGVILDAIHEIDILMWLFGNVERVFCDAGTLGDLDLDVEDFAVMSLRHEAGVQSEIQLDYLRGLRRRGGEVVGSKGTVAWQCDGKKPQACWVGRCMSGENQWENLLDEKELNAAPMYARVMERFLDAAQGKETPDLMTGREALRVLAVALAAKQSADSGKAMAPQERVTSS